MYENLVIDCHADTLLKKFMSKSFDPIYGIEKPTFHASKELLKKGGVNIQVYAIFVPSKLEKLGIEITLEMIAIAKELEKDDFPILKTKLDLKKAKNHKGSVSMILSMEGAIALERNIKLLPIFYELGIRNIGLSWSRKNLFAQGTNLTSKKVERGGLSSEGKDLVEKMDSLGMVIDVSHLNKEGFRDVVNLTMHPFIASHSNAWNLCSHSRNLNDEQIENLASAEGVIGINFYPKFLVEKDVDKASISNVIEHIKYISDLVGVEHVGLGSDFDGFTKPPIGLENASKIKKIPPLLKQEGFSNNEISKIMGGNLERVFTKVWK